MKRSTKIWMIVWLILVKLGCMIWVGVITIAEGDFMKLSTVEYETNRHQVLDTFSNISIEADTADIVFTLSDDKVCRVECYEENKARHSVAVTEDTLVIRTVNEKAWYDYIRLHFDAPKITVYLPQTEYKNILIKGKTGDVTVPHMFHFETVDISLGTGDTILESDASKSVKIETKTGEIDVKNAAIGSLDMSTSTGIIRVRDVICTGNISAVLSTGKTELVNVKCNNLHSKGQTGKIVLDKVMAEGGLSVTRDTGDVRMVDCDASEMHIETDTGDVTCSLLSAKVFITHTNTGDVVVPESVAGGRCEITTDTGDIKVTIG